MESCKRAHTLAYEMSRDGTIGCTGRKKDNWEETGLVKARGTYGTHGGRG